MHIAFIGDSFVNGTGDPEYLGWVGRVCANAHRQGCEITAYNLGIRGNTSTDIKERWQQEVTRRFPPAEDCRIVFSFGVNDTTWENGKTRVDGETSIENTSEILRLARSQYPILMLGLAPIDDRQQNDRSKQLSKQFSLVCAELNIPYLDIFSPLQHSTIWVKEVAENDGAHPRNSGYAELARLVETWSEWKSWVVAG